MAKTKHCSDANGKSLGWIIQCPACNNAHRLSDDWNFNNNVDKPSFIPSLLVQTAQAIKKFPILRSGRKKPFPEAYDYIPWSIIAPHEEQAIKNHNQTLTRLADRCGLSPAEAVCVITGKPFSDVKLLTDDEADKMLIELCHGHDMHAEDVICHSFIVNGDIRYLSDCTHAMAGKTVSLPDIT